MGKRRNAYKIFIGKPEGKKPLVITGRKWEDNIRMDLRGKGCESTGWMHVDRDSDQWRAL
jgi:hypothetical protein